MSAAIKFLESADREMIKRLCQDNPDWEEIPMVLAETYVLFEYAIDQGEPSGAINALRCVAEVIYSRGYRRGERNANRPEFVCKGD